jgi:hypothetical protein
VLVNTDEGRKRLEHIRHDPRITLDLLVDGWHRHGALKNSSQPGQANV